jgi:hypothetical protein
MGKEREKIHKDTRPTNRIREREKERERDN